MRDTIFISHANPEDNEISLWLALQLSKLGYPVWCDLTDLLGGEVIWKDAEKVIRERTTKFLFVLSKNSNNKSGPRKELQTALNTNKKLNIDDFVIPLLVDDLLHTEMNIQLADLNAIGFREGWATGLTTLLEKLEKDKVSKNPTFDSGKVTEWWKTNFESGKWLVKETEEYLSNWFPVESLPENIFFHSIENRAVGASEFKGDLDYPVFNHNQHLVSFATKVDLKSIPEPFFIKDSFEVKTRDLLAGNIEGILKPQARIIISHLLNVGWMQFVADKKMPFYLLANNKMCFFFSNNVLPEGKIKFKNEFGKNTFRKMVGNIGVRKFKKFGTGLIRHWHFGISAKPLFFPKLVFTIYPHVLFSDDGFKIWDDKKKLHKARRRYCNLWWNEEWRDKIIHSIKWLAENKPFFEIKMGSNVSIKVLSSPLKFKSPISYRVPSKVIKIEEVEFEEEETEVLPGGEEV